MMPNLRARVAVAFLAALLLPCTRPCLAQKGGPSPAYKAELRKTLEQRRQRRARGGNSPATNSIVPWLMPPTLIIRATPEVHNEVQSLFWLLRRSP
jgi:hypothetical protein